MDIGTEMLAHAVDRFTDAFEAQSVNPIAEAYLQRREIRKRWPNLPSGISANEKFQQMVAVLGEEPSLEECLCEDFFDVMLTPGSEITVKFLSLEWAISPHKARAWLYFMELCGRVWQVGKDAYVLCPKPTEQLPQDFWKTANETANLDALL